MIKIAVEQWEKNKGAIYDALKAKHPENYKEVVKIVIENITMDGCKEFSPDPNCIHEIDDGDYQGTLLYVIGEKEYQPHEYWYVKVWYGSCSGCDTLEGIRDYEYTETPSDAQAKQYSDLALHIVQNLKKME